VKKKPDISSFGLSKDPSAFLEAGAGDLASNSAAQARQAQPPKKPEPTIQKLFRLRWDTAYALKMHAVRESVESGSRVTETEIVEALIRKHFGLSG
jgi:hypothetical protein